MPSALAIVGVVICLSLLEGVWTWLLATAAAEVSDQSAQPPYLLIGLVVFGAWFAARSTTVARVPLHRRRWILAGGGIALACAAGTIQAGLLHPLQLVLGTFEPDYRGAGMVVLIAVTYLWGRGLALGSRVNRARILNHIGVSASGLVLILLFLPLTQTVGQLGMPAVIISFLLSLAALLTEQLAGAESRRLTRLQWASLGAGVSLALIVVASIFAGIFGQGLVVGGQALSRVGRFISPVTDAVLLAAGYLAYYLTLLFSWLATVFGSDPEAVNRAMQEAQERQPRFENEAAESPPEILTALVAIFCTLLFAAIAIALFHRLAGRIGRQPEDFVVEAHTHLPGPGARDRLRSALDWLRRRDAERADEDPRSAIRRHYRSFQTMLARAQLPRRVQQTPREYEQVVARALPPSREPAGALTDAYTVARYAGPAEPLPDPAGVGAALNRVRDALRSSDERIGPSS